MKQLFAKKSVSSLLREAKEIKGGLRRTLGPMNLITMGIGAVIGAGLFVLTGDVAARFSGPAIVFSFFIGGVIAAIAALCYAEFASLIPVAGSAYTYAFVAVGEFFAWIMGCALTIEYIFSFSTVAVAWSSYFTGLMSDFGWTISHLISSAPLSCDSVQGWISTGALCNVPAMLIIALIAFLVSRGIQTASFLNDLLVFVKLGVILLFVGFGIAFVQAENLTPFIPENSGTFGEYGWSGIFRGAGVLFFAFLGFDAVATLAQEAKNPQRDMPVGMMGSLLICTLVYIIFGIVMTGVVDYRSLKVADPVGVAINAFGPRFFWLRYIIKFAILSGLTSVILVMMTAQARIFYVMAKDGLLPKIFGVTHSKFLTPFYATIFIALISLFLSGFFPVDVLGQLTSMGALFVFGMVCLGVLILRFTQPRLERPFKTPFAPWVPLFGFLFCFFQMALMPWVTWMQFVSLLAIGSLFYFLYGYRHSTMRK